MMSAKMKQHPWKLFFENCKSIPNNCIPTIYEIDNLSSNFAKVINDSFISKLNLLLLNCIQTNIA